MVCFQLLLFEVAIAFSGFRMYPTGAAVGVSRQDDGGRSTWGAKGHILLENQKSRVSVRHDFSFRFELSTELPVVSPAWLSVLAGSASSEDDKLVCALYGCRLDSRLVHLDFKPWQLI
jgi:hypothetical protein